MNFKLLSVTNKSSFALRLSLLVLILCLAGFSGCGGKNTKSVSGVVTLDGNPLPFAEVTFVMMDGSGRPAEAVTDEQGRFALSTFGKKDGAVPGEYRVMVRKFDGAAKEFVMPDIAKLAEASRKTKEAAKKKMEDDKRKARQNNEVWVEPPPTPPKTSILHENYTDFSKTPLMVTIPAKSIRLALTNDGK